MTTAFHTANQHSPSVRSSIITISTSTPPAIYQAPAALWAARKHTAMSSLRSTGPVEPAFGAVAWALAAIVGIVLGIAIGLVSAGFDTTRLLLAAGAVALGLGWLIALVTSPFMAGRTRR